MLNSRQREYLNYNLKQEQAALNDLKKLYKQALDDINNQIAMLMGRTDTENLASIIYQLDYQKALKKQVGAILDTLHSKEYSRIEDYLKDCYENSFIGTMYDIHGQGIPLTIPINQEQVLNALTTNSKLSKPLYDRLGEDITTLKRKVSSEISRGIANNYSYDTIARNLSNTSKIGINNAYRIARTEGHRIQSQSAMDAALKAKESGADVVKQWDASLDSRTRPHHAQLDGQIRELDEPFEVAGRKAMYPSGFGIASEDIQCRCALLQRAKWALDDEELDVLKERAKYYGLDKTKDFEDFKQKYLGYQDNLLTKNVNSANNMVDKFVPATKVTEAEEYARNVLGIKNVSYKGVDVTTANEWNKGLKDTFDKFPELKSKFGFVGECHERNKMLKSVAEKHYMDQFLKNNPTWTAKQLQPYVDKKVRSLMKMMQVSKRTFAQSWTPNNPAFKDFAGITVNSIFGKKSKSFIKELIANVQTKFHPEGCSTIRSVLDHEIGHQLDDLLGIGKIKKIQDLFDSRTFDELTDALSKYAWDNNNSNKYSEMIAEAWAEYCNNPNPREIAKTVGETIMEEYQKQFGTK